MSRVELAISASRGRALCALRVAQRELLVHRAPAEGGRGDVAPVVAELFRTAGLGPTDLDAMRVDVGPGSYTGLRIAITFARTIAAFRAVPMHELTSFELYAAAARRAQLICSRSTVQVAVDARRDRLHTARLSIGDAIEVIEAPRAIDIGSLAAELHATDVVLGDAVALAALGPRCRELGNASVGIVELTGADLFDAALRPRPTSPERIEPLYLMGSYAEDG